MKKAFQLAVLVVFLTSTVLAGGGGVPGARTLRAGVRWSGVPWTACAATADLPRPGRLRRSRRRRHRPAGKSRPRSEKGRFSGVRGREASIDQYVHLRGHSDRAGGSSVVRGLADRAGREDERASVRRPGVRDGGRRPAHAVRTHAARQGGGEAVHRAPPGRQRSDGDRSHRRSDRREPGIHQQQAAAACVARQDAGTQARFGDREQDDGVLPHARFSAAGRRAERSRGRRASVQRAQYAADTEERGGVVRIGARAPQDNPAAQRRDRL